MGVGRCRDESVDDTGHAFFLPACEPSRFKGLAGGHLCLPAGVLRSAAQLTYSSRPPCVHSPGLLPQSRSPGGGAASFSVEIPESGYPNGFVVARRRILLSICLSGFRP